MSSTLTTTEVAAKLKTDPRELRRFLRSRKEGVGTGKRYSITADIVPALKRDFTTWKKAEDARRAAKSGVAEQVGDGNV